MLVELRCDAFVSYEQPRETIRFHKGLNTVLGGAAANNSIGKSTFLLIIDYCFGGSSYGKADIKNYVGDHTICFAFEFDEKKYYFSRTVSTSDKVSLCDSEYRMLEEWKLVDFNKFLFNKYFPKHTEGTFREMVSRFFRVAGKKNDTVINPLNDASPKMEAAITAMEKLFGLYSYVGTVKKQLKEAEDKQKALNKAQKYDLVPKAIKTDKQYAKNLERIEELRAKLEELTQDTDQDLLLEELKRKDNAAEINNRLQGMKRQYRKLASQYRIVTKNKDESFLTTEEDLQRLASFFPTVEIKHIQEVEGFHRKLHGILTSQMNEEAEALRTLITAATAEIQKLETELAELGVPLYVPKPFLERYTELDREISALEAQNEVYDNKVKFKEDVEQITDELDSSEAQVLGDIQARINAQMVRLNDFIYEEVREAPVLTFESRKKYNFDTPHDGGTGTAYKSLVVLDMSVMELTDLPAVAHDSSIFKNIGDEPIDKIMELYQNSEKQVFIAFDKEQSYSEQTGKILNDTAVLRLDEGGNELFGYSWAKKKKPKKK